MMSRHASMRNELMRTSGTSSFHTHLPNPMIFGVAIPGTTCPNNISPYSPFLHTSSALDLDTLDHVGSLNGFVDKKFIQDDYHHKTLSSHKTQDSSSLRLNLIRTWARSHLRNFKYDAVTYPRKFFANNIVLSKGIRHSVNGIMHHFKSSDESSIFYLPDDVYPVYSQIASKIGVPFTVYKTIAQSGLVKNLGFLTEAKCSGMNEIAVIADPVPLSRTVLRKEERDRLIEWLQAKKNRFVVIDSVYGSLFNPNLESLFSTQRVFYLNSMSKSHCSPNMMGFNIVPENLYDFLRETLERELTDETLGIANIVLGVYEQSDAMNFQSELFTTAWKLIDQQLITKGFKKTNPELGQSPYLKTYQASYQTLLDSKIIGIPPDVYERSDLTGKISILSCLDQTKQIVALQDQQVSKTMYCVTVLSNFFKAYDKYTNLYSKVHIPESSFPDKFHLLTADDIAVGILKATKLRNKLGIQGDELILIETKIQCTQELFRTEITGKGYYIKSPHITVNKLYFLDPLYSGVPHPSTSGDTNYLTTVENVMAKSMALNKDNFKPYHDLVPRSISLLPIAKGCQAKCSFCFSHSSVSDDTPQKLLGLGTIETILRESKARGAERVVITGGGEPTLVPHHLLLKYIGLCRQYFDKIVMITNGYVYSNKRVSEEHRFEHLRQLLEAGLSVLSVSRHGYDEETNTKIMNLETKSTVISETMIKNPSVFKSLKLRWICVLQKGGVEGIGTLEKYLDFATETAASQICFKELYVSVSEESVYYNSSYNQYSRNHQVPLSMVTNYLDSKKAKLLFTLPWGSPVYEHQHNGKTIQIACYTEPSLFWERSSGICRSWNLMADSKIYASLEDLSSEIIV